MTTLFDYIIYHTGHLFPCRSTHVKSASGTTMSVVMVFVTVSSSHALVLTYFTQCEGGPHSHKGGPKYLIV